MKALKNLQQFVRDTLHRFVLPIRNFLMHPIWCYSVLEIAEIIKRDWYANSPRGINIGERRLLEVERIGAGGFHTTFAVCRWIGQDIGGWVLEHEPETHGVERSLKLERDRIVAVHEIPQRAASRQNPTGLRCAGLDAHKQDPVVGQQNLSETK